VAVEQSELGVIWTVVGRLQVVPLLLLLNGPIVSTPFA